MRDIPFSSMCEHHILPFTGRAHVAYIPRAGRITGLSKIARCVQGYARRLQLQERLTAQIADALMAELEPLGVLVVLEAEHTCMTMRGVRAAGALTVTSAVRGGFKKRHQDARGGPAPSGAQWVRPPLAPRGRTGRVPAPSIRTPRASAGSVAASGQSARRSRSGGARKPMR